VGSTTNQTRPVQVLDQVTDFAVGNQFTCAIRANRILCWGRNADGEMGDGSGLNRTSPNEALDIIPGTMVAIEAGSAHACVRHDTGLVKCWGDNGSGQLGRGDTSDAFIPWLTLGSGVQSMALGQDHSCFLMADQTVRCVGNAQSFQTGTGSTATITNLSTAPTTLSTVSTIWTGRSSSTCALQTNNSVQCWGRNSGLFIPRFPPLSHLPRPIPLAQ
jgi:alpha-tubulin suppressor-like RCC1 family protein